MERAPPRRSRQIGSGARRARLVAGAVVHRSSAAIVRVAHAGTCRSERMAPTREVKLLEARPQGNGWIARLEGVDERDGASRLTGQMILVERDELPPAEGREHYRDDLVGFEAKNLEGALLGAVDHFVDTPGNAVMVIKGAREHLGSSDRAAPAQRRQGCAHGCWWIGPRISDTTHAHRSRDIVPRADPARR